MQQQMLLAKPNDINKDFRNTPIMKTQRATVVKKFICPECHKHCRILERCSVCGRCYACCRR